MINNGDIGEIVIDTEGVKMDNMDNNEMMKLIESQNKIIEGFNNEMKILRNDMEIIKTVDIDDNAAKKQNDDDKDGDNDKYDKVN